eukprot:GHVN01065206.1.p1 GENE.GHVN01065206.1~~GHVN01065206.1.p1  ORF type:complete len:155 (+),score=23.61 GHVN01065206.1:211-675(+)
MVSFTCDTCNDTLKKSKVDAHKRGCRTWSFRCVDCLTVFENDEYKGHEDCISEEQKHQGTLYKPKQAKQAPVNTEVVPQLEWSSDWKTTMSEVLKRQKGQKMAWKDLRDQVVAMRIRAEPSLSKKRKKMESEFMCEIPELYLSSTDRFVRFKRE